MNIKIIAVGKLKEKYTKDAIEEFKKRLNAYCSLTLTEIPAQEIKDENLASKYMEAEGEKILTAIKPDSYVITLEINGKMLSSEDFSQKIKDLANEGHNEIVFVIGGANGLAPRADVARCKFKLSFSKDFHTPAHTHFLIEQITEPTK